ncbi:MAG: Outer membrane protein assembly factor BamD [Alphaproteobacteria bacterium MarineAlpha9_Bin2]|nr:MAG: Outer membrane protein assembly factor BamD [Alphaproteobacteria bacterium MarineAlpha9_Bin2]
MSIFQVFNLNKFFLLTFLVLLFACSSSDKKKEYTERSVEEIYNSALSSMKEKDYHTAAQEFEEVERQHPYSIWAKQAQIMTAYARYMRNDYDMVISAAKRYIELHPGADDVDYAYYLVALSFYERISDVKREQSMTTSALQTFEELIRRFPNSIYSKDARQKLFLVKDHLAGKDMEVGRTYMRFDNYISAINRFKNVVDNYQTTSHVPEALARLTELYYVLGIYEEAKSTAAVLGHNFPDNYWHQYTYELLTEYRKENFKNQMLSDSVNKDESSKSMPKKNNQNDDPNISLLDEILHFFDEE